MYFVGSKMRNMDKKELFLLLLLDGHLKAQRFVAFVMVCYDMHCFIYQKCHDKKYVYHPMWLSYDERKKLEAK